MSQQWTVRKGLPVSMCLFMALFPLACTTFTPTHPYDETARERFKGASGGHITSVDDSGEAVAHTPEEETARQAGGISGDPSSPDAASNGGLTLEDCIALALRNSPLILAAEDDADAERAEKKVKGAARWPNIHVTGSYFHHQDTQRLGVPSPPGQPQYFTDDLVSADIVLRLPLYAGGRIVNEIRAAELLAQAEAHRLNRSREEVVFNVTSTYYSILAQERVIESASFSKKTLEEHQARVQSLIESQKAARVDALRTGVRLADVEHQLLQERNTLRILRRVLINLMGQGGAPSAGMAIAGPLAPVEENAPLSLDESMARACDQREDYAAAVAELQAQAKRVDIARGEREPAVSFEAAYGGRWGIGGTGEQQANSSNALGIDAAGNPTWTRTSPVSGGGSLTSTFGPQGLASQRYTLPSGEPADSFEDLGRLGITIDVPIFEGGRLRAQVARERAKLRAAQQRLRKLEQDIWLEVETAVLNVNSAFERTSVTRKSVAEAEESLHIERQKYDLGKGAIVDVLDAQRALLDAQTNYFRALSDYHIARAQVRLATGDTRS
jgi:outer membrane protein